MQPCVDDLADDFDNLSINSTATTAIETKRSTSSGSETTTTTATTTTTTTTTSIASSSSKPHAPSHDPCWDAIRHLKSKNTTLSLDDLRFVRRLGSGDIGSVYLVELKEGGGGGGGESGERTKCMFAAKVMDKKELVGRNKDGRAKIERDILEILDHPFLPTLYATLDTSRWSCLLTEFCPGGDLHVLRQNQPDKRFGEPAVRCVKLVNIHNYILFFAIIIQIT